MLQRLALAAVCLALTSLACSGPSRPAGPPAPPKRLILLSIDGGGDWLVDRSIADGAAPAFERLGKEGASADAMISVMPSLTAVAHSSLWTGAWPRDHGVSGNNVALLPRADHTVLEWRSGFLSDALRAEPIWMAAARAGRRVLVLQATGGFPFSSQFGDRLLQFDAYANTLLPPTRVAGRMRNGRHEFAIGETPFVLTVADGMPQLESGGTRQPLRAGHEGDFTPPIAVRVGGQDALVRLRLFTYNAASGDFVLFHGAVRRVTSNQPDRLPSFLAKAGTLVGEAVDIHYRAGGFGPTFATGGDGDAERWLTDYLLANQDYFTGAVEFAASEPWDLLVLYVSNFDAGAHALMGMIDQGSRAYTPEREAKAWPVLRSLFTKTVDDFVADIRRRFSDATLVVVSDHGLEGAGRFLLPNVALKRAGLLRLKADGTIDLARSKATYIQERGPMIFINSRDWKGGVVGPAEREAVKRQVETALLSIRDPETKGPAIHAVFDPDREGMGLGIGGPVGGDVYFDPQPGYYTNGGTLGDRVIIETPPMGIGFHAFAPWRRGLHAIFYAVGPGVAPGRHLGIIRSVDVAATAAALGGFPAPANSIGRAIPLD